MNCNFNNKMVTDMNTKLQEIDESLSIGKISSCDKKIRSLGLHIPIKGNAEIIKKLERIGFEKDYKEKRGNSFYQIMTYYINYDKYAIYQGKYGLYSRLYIDNIYDFKRHHIMGKPDFPMTVNRSGGHCPFDKNEKNFLYIKEVLENEEPLTREEMFPKNNDNFYYGWIDTQGNTYSCGFENHSFAADYICEELGFGFCYAERTLEEKGWLKVSRKAPYTPDNYDSRTVYSTTFRLTKAQIDKLYELGLEKDKMIAWLIRDNEDIER